MIEQPDTLKRKKYNWAPYLLILPSFVYLIVFFAWPMVQAFILTVKENDVLLKIHEEPVRSSSTVGLLPRGISVGILDQQANIIDESELNEPGLITELWLNVQFEDDAGTSLTGWAPERRFRIRETDENNRPIKATVRTIIGEDTDPHTPIYLEPSESSEKISHLESQTPVEVIDQMTLEIWFQVSGDVDDETVVGWVQSRYLKVFPESNEARIESGDTGQFTFKFIKRMFNDRFFWPAFRTTLLLTIVVIPLQFILAIIMALVIQTNLKGSSIFLGIFSIALGVSDLAVGIVWYAIFTNFGYLNTILERLGLISAPITYLSADTRHWIIIAIVLAEIWRATSLVMVIVVSGMQAISQDVLEAAELFGASLWQRVKHIILPLLKPSLQVALILRTILALQVFSVVMAIGGGAVVTVLARETYRQYYDLRNFHMAASYATFILLISMVTSVFYLKAVRTEEEVQG
jgi:multiple sugar transport system permease protein